MYTDKPQTLSVKHFLIRKMSTAASIPEKTIASVIDHQFITLIENMPSSNSLELSGFGKFMFHKNKAPKTMLNYLKDQQEIIARIPQMESADRKRAEIKLSNIELKIKVLNQKLQSYENQFCTNIRGMEKSIDSSSRDETADKGSGE